MALRGAAIKAVKFPDLKLGDNSGSSWGLDAMFGRLVSALGTTLGKVMSGVTTYLGDILTAIVNPEAGVGKGIDHAIEQQAVFNSTAARQREGMNEFKSVGDNTMRGDYALETLNDQGKKSYSLMSNSLDVNGKLTGTAASTISQGRDIIGAYNDARDYGAVDLSRVYQGIQRLQETANTKGSVILDEEFVNRMFGPTASQHAGLEKVKMKYVKVANDADYMNSQHQYMMNDTGWGTAADVVGYGVGAAELVGTSVGTGGVGLFTKGAQIARAAKAGKAAYGVRGMVAGVAKNGFSWGNAAKGVAKGWFGEKIGNAVVGGVAGWFENDNHLELVPADDPRPAASVDGMPTGIREYYRAKPEVIQALMAQFDPNNTQDRELILSNMEKHIIQKAGGQQYVDNMWRLKGQDSGYFAQQKVLDVSEQLGKYQELRNIRQKYDNILANDEWSQYKNTIGNNFKYVTNQAVNWAGGVLQGAGQMIGLTGGTRRITNAEAKKNGVYIMNDLIKRGLQPHQAAGIVGNLMAESGLNPSSNAIDTNGLRAGGLAAWNGPLWNGLHQYAQEKGKPWNDINLQLDYLRDLLNKNTKQMNDVRARLQKSQTPYDASDAWAYYERYAGYNYDPNTARQAGWSIARIKKEHDNRGANANGFMELWNQANGQDGGIANYLGDNYPVSGYSGSSELQQPGSAQPFLTSSYTNTSSSYTSVAALGSAAPVIQSTGGISYTPVVVATGGGIPIQVDEVNNSQTFTHSSGVALVGDSWGVGMAPYWGKQNTIAVSGYKVSQVAGLVAQAKSTGYGTIVVYCGLNSCKSSEADIISQFEQLVANAGGSKLVLCTGIRIKTPDLLPYVSKVNGIIRGIAARYKCGLIDLEQSSGNYQQFIADPKPDGSNRDATFHMTAKGYQELVKEIKSKLSGGNYVPAIQQQEVRETGIDLVSNDGFFVPGSEYSPQSGLSNSFNEMTDYLQNVQVFSDVKTQGQIQLENQDMASMEKASEIWDMFGPELQRSYSSFNDFLADYSGLTIDNNNQLGHLISHTGGTREDLYSRAKKYSEALSLWNSMPEDLRKKKFNNIEDAREFALRFAGFDDEDTLGSIRESVKKYVTDYNRRQTFDYNQWIKDHEGLGLGRSAASYVGKERDLLLALMEGDEEAAEDLYQSGLNSYIQGKVSVPGGKVNEKDLEFYQNSYEKIKTYIRHQDMYDRLNQELVSVQAAENNAKKKYEIAKKAFEYLDGTWVKNPYAGGNKYIKQGGLADNVIVYQARDDGAIGSNPAMRALYDAAIEMGWNPERDGKTVADIKKALGGMVGFESYLHDYEREYTRSQAATKHVQGKINTIDDQDVNREEKRTSANASEYDKQTRELDEINNKKKDIEFEIQKRNAILNGGAASMKEQDLALREKMELEKQLTEISQSLIDKLTKSNASLKAQREKADKAAKALGTNIKEIERIYFSLLASGKSHQEVIQSLQQQYGKDVVSYLQKFDENSRAWVYKAKKDLQEMMNRMRHDWAQSFEFSDEDGKYRFLMANGFNQYNSTPLDRDLWLAQNTKPEVDPITGKLITKKKDFSDYDSWEAYQKAQNGDGSLIGFGKQKKSLLKLPKVDIINSGGGTSSGPFQRTTLGVVNDRSNGLSFSMKPLGGVTLGLNANDFNEGGWTPDGSVNTPYHQVNGKWEYGEYNKSKFGYEIGGEVTFHGGEYVIPKYLAQQPIVRSMIDDIEARRKETISSQRLSSGKMREPENFTASMISQQQTTNELLNLIIQTNAKGFTSVAQVTAASSSIPGPIQGQSATRSFNYK